MTKEHWEGMLGPGPPLLLRLRRFASCSEAAAAWSTVQSPESAHRNGGST